MYAEAALSINSHLGDPLRSYPELRKGYGKEVNEELVWNPIRHAIRRRNFKNI